MDGYYATYKNIGDSDIAVFQTEQERNDWVNFNDPYSKAFGVTSENSTFEREIMSVEEAELRIKNMLYTKDEFNTKQEWYIGY